MPKTKILSIISLCLIVAALAATRGVGRIETAVLEKLPVESFPKAIGDWGMVVEHKVDPEVQAKVPTAVIVDRVYRHLDGREVNLTLLTATDYADFHDPNICFPGQGFQLSKAQNTTVGDFQCNVMLAERMGTRMRVVYWWSGAANVDTTYGREQMGRILALRDRITGETGHSLFVRVIAPENDMAEKTVQEFIELITPILKELEASGTDPNQP